MTIINSGSIIKLNVGGKTFYTYFNILNISTYFTNLLSGSMQTNVYAGKDNDEVFIDRSGDMFRHVLQYLRTNQIFLQDKITLKKLKIEANYYDISSLANSIDKLLAGTIENKDEYLFISPETVLEMGMKHLGIASDDINYYQYQLVENFDTYETRNTCPANHQIGILCGNSNHVYYDILYPIKKTIIRKYK